MSMDATLKRHLGRQARAARLRLGLTQAQVAERAELALAVYGRVERGGMMPTPATLLRLCRALEVDANELLGFSAPVPPPWWRSSMQAAHERPSVQQFVSTAQRLGRRQLTALGYMARAMLHADDAPGTRDSRSAAE